MTLSNKSPCSCDSFLRSINLKFILSKIFLDLCITSDKTQPSPPLTFWGPFHLPTFRGKSENKKPINAKRSLISKPLLLVSARQNWSSLKISSWWKYPLKVKMVEGSASAALLVVNKLPALQALALDYATGEEKDASHHHHHHHH